MVGLATALGDADPHELRDRLDETARPLFGLGRAALHEQAAELGEAITNRLGLRATANRHGHILLNHALAERAAQPILLAALGHELARHAGLASVVARSRDDYWTLLTADDMFLPIGYGNRSSLTTSELQACCAHEIAHQVLLRIAADGAPERVRRANRLRVALTSACASANPTCRKRQ
jgi:hypothetical protein